MKMCNVLPTTHNHLRYHKTVWVVDYIDHIKWDWIRLASKEAWLDLGVGWLDLDLIRPEVDQIWVDLIYIA